MARRVRSSWPQGSSLIHGAFTSPSQLEGGGEREEGEEGDPQAFASSTPSRQIPNPNPNPNLTAAHYGLSSSSGKYCEVEELRNCRLNFAPPSTHHSCNGEPLTRANNADFPSRILSLTTMMPLPPPQLRCTIPDKINEVYD